MATLTEKETRIESGLVTVEFLAEYRNGVLDQILCSVSVDESLVKWHYSQEHGLHPIYRNGKETRVFRLLQALINPEVFQQIENQIKQFQNDSKNQRSG